MAATVKLEAIDDHVVRISSSKVAIALENRDQRLAADAPEVCEYMASYAPRHRTTS